MSRHVERIHMRTRELKCDHCDYAARDVTHLRRHIEVHTNDKRFKCQFTGRIKVWIRGIMKNFIVNIEQNNLKQTAIFFLYSLFCPLGDFVQLCYRRKTEYQKIQVLRRTAVVQTFHIDWDTDCFGTPIGLTITGTNLLWVPISRHRLLLLTTHLLMMSIKPDR